MKNHALADVVENESYILDWFVLAQIYHVNFRVLRLAHHKCFFKIELASFYALEQRKFYLRLRLLRTLVLFLAFRSLRLHKGVELIDFHLFC